MNLYLLKGLFAFLAILIILIISKNLLELFTNRDMKMDKKRKAQLNFDNKRTSSQDMNAMGLIDTVTNPVRKYILPKINVNETKRARLEKDIMLADWKGFDATTFMALDITLKCVGLIFGLIFLTKSTFMAILWFIIPFFGLRILFNNSISNRKYNLLSEFPDFIRITQGFLCSDIPLVEAIENTIPFVGPTWKPLLREFVINANIYSQNECINELKEKVPIFEVNELWSLIQLNLDQGVDVRQSFDNQAEKVKALQKEVMLNKITKRQMLATLIQAPLLLCMMAGFGLPTFKNMINLDF